MSGFLNGLPGGGTPEETLEKFAKLQMQHHPGQNLGPMMIGLVLDLVLFGVSYHQFMVFLRHPVQDRRFVRYLVFWTFTVGTATSAYGIYYVYDLFVSGFGLYKNFLLTDKVSIYGILSTAVTIPVQVFYLDRAYKLFGRKWWIPAAAVPLMLGSIVGGIAATYFMRGMINFDQLKICFYLWTIMTVCADLYLTILMLVGLSRAKTGFNTTDALVSRLIRTSAEAQIPPTAGAIAFLISYAIDREAKINFFFPMMLGKVYVVSLLAVLNFRVVATPTNLITGPRLIVTPEDDDGTDEACCRWGTKSKSGRPLPASGLEGVRPGGDEDEWAIPLKSLGHSAAMGHEISH